MRWWLAKSLLHINPKFRTLLPSRLAGIYRTFDPLFLKAIALNVTYAFGGWNIIGTLEDPLNRKIWRISYTYRTYVTTIMTNRMTDVASIAHELLVEML